MGRRGQAPGSGGRLLEGGGASASGLGVPLLLDALAWAVPGPKPPRPLGEPVAGRDGDARGTRLA